MILDYQDIVLLSICIMMSSGSDQSICGILYQIAKTTTIGILDKSGFLMVDLRPVPKQFSIRTTIHQMKLVVLYRFLRKI